MQKHLIFIILTFLYSHYSFGQGSAKEKILERLQERKVSYQEYQKDSARRDKLRMSDAQDQKVLRKKYENKKEKARDSFVRVERKIPYTTYLKFVEEREKERNEMERARQKEVQDQQSIRETYEKSRYKIYKMEQ